MKHNPLPCLVTRSATVMLITVLALLHGCAAVNTERAMQRPVSHAIPQETPVPLKEFLYKPAENKQESGFILVDAPLDALAVRLWLAENAEKTLDLQYYIYHGDKTGKLVAAALLAAADRGVRVRVLLDDIYTAKNEASMLALDSHPNVEIRLYNAFHYRGGSPITQLFEYFSKQGRPNRRMHNKLFAADNQMAITGGRNIGDEYFQAHQDLSFVDLDVLSSGPITGELSKSFDDYWNSDAVIPARAIPGFKRAREYLPQLRESLQAHAFEMASTEYGQSLADLPLLKKLYANEAPWLGASAHTLADPPDKIEGQSHISETLIGQLAGLHVDPRHEAIIISPYFVPGDIGTQWLQYLRGKGVKVRILTNSLAANDVPLVHAGYSRYREPLLASGIEIHELKPVPNRAARRPHRISSGSSRASLHAKSFVFDRENVFIGSFNFDPRSAHLNTELALLINSQELSEQVAKLAENAMSTENSYQVKLVRNSDQETGLNWIGKNDGVERVLDNEPESTKWQRFLLKLLAILPIEQNL